MFLKWYRLGSGKCGLKYLVYLMSFLSNLALDPHIVEYSARNSSRNKGSEAYFGYVFSVMGENILVRPVMLLGSMRRVHKRYVTFSYIADRPYSIGGFIVGRISSKAMEEFSEQTSLLPHLDLRCRRIVVDAKALGELSDLNYWFTPIAMLSGLHRWGFSWKRIILSTIPVYILHNWPPSINDLELISASIVEYVYNRRMYRAYGEERYMTTEAGRLLRELDERIKSFMESRGSRDLSRIKEFLNKLCREVRKYIDNDVSILLEIYEELLLNNNLSRRSEYRLYLLDVYKQNLESLNKVINGMISSIRRAKHKTSLIIIIVATETMSPIYISFIIDKTIRELSNRQDLIRKINTIKLLLLYTPQVLPQVIYSIYVLKDLGRIREYGDKTSLKINSSVQSPRSDNSLPMYIELKPLIDKQPTLIYTELKAIFEEYSRENIKLQVIYTPYHTGTISVLAALKRLSNEYKNNPKISIREIL